MSKATLRTTLIAIAWAADAGRQFPNINDPTRDLFRHIRDMAREALSKDR